ncbi:MAG TPA: Ada metal-binding domain-containing protein [Caldimonas sp.]|jgi:AraC family transcriptional regulator of adaptative response / DNA-3-methyladenine glycosylase II|nr:Ada metal-binding domain-containing protein [Caldimonas sp.]HEX2540249.1 Ada metal-binding domain-containing protein [Caldimonas sp.]
MTIDGDAAYQILLAHDARFDGKLFVGVTSTGVYCRPICRVRMPARRNCRFFATPAQAEAAQFRPCLKCRPELAPGPGLPWTVMDASRTLARQAAMLLEEESASDEAPGVAAVAARLGVSDRHLRRIFFSEHGVTPLQYLQTRRLLLAKQLLTDTDLPVAQIALTSGYRSLRRFNAAFASGYRMNPMRLRRTAAAGARTVPRRGGPAAKPADGVDSPPVSVLLGYRPPYDRAALLAFIAQRAIPCIEAVDGPVVRRTVRAGALGPEAGWLEARFVADHARVRLSFAPSLGASSGAVIAAVRRWLDLDAAPDTIDQGLAGLPGDPGLRLPGSVDPFELAVRAVLGQQVTVAAARTLARRVVERFGSIVETPWDDVARAFPGPDALAGAPLERIAELGIIRSRAGAIRAIAAAWPDLARLFAPASSPEVLVDRLRELPGIGPWTAHYVAMRGLGWPDAFPPGDVAALKAMRQLFGAATQRASDTHAEAWRPWRSYALLRLWNSLGATP